MEQKKLLWIVFSMTLFLLIVVGIGIIWLYPGPQQPVVAEEQMPAREAGAEFDPVEWVRSEQEAPGLDEIPSGEEGEESFVVVYGEAAEEDQTVKPAVQEDRELSGSPQQEQSPAVHSDKDAGKTVKKEETAAPRAVAPAPQTISVKEYWIQTGSYISRSRADRIKEELDEIGLSGRILSKDVNGTQYYRVRIGPYSQKAEADKFLSWVKEKDDFQNSYISEVSRMKTVAQ